MDLKQLEYFVRVAELGSFTRAAVALQVAQPALSRQVRLLEVELRQNLLVRNGRGATPTEAGKLLLAHGRGILHQVQRAQEDLGRLRGALAGRVAIGLPTSVARVLAVPLTRAFRQQMPDAQLSISEGLTAAMSEGVSNGRLDIVVLYNARSGDGLDVTPVLQEELVLVAPRPPGLAEDPPPPPLPWPELARLPLIIPTRPNAIRMHVEAEMASHGLRPQVSLEIDGVSAILDLVADGAGCAILTRNAVAQSLKPSAYTLRPIGPPLLRIDLGVAVSSQRPTTLTQQAALRLVQHQLQLAIPGVPLALSRNS